MCVRARVCVCVCVKMHGRTSFTWLFCLRPCVCGTFTFSFAWIVTNYKRPALSVVFRKITKGLPSCSHSLLDHSRPEKQIKNGDGLSDVECLQSWTFWRNVEGSFATCPGRLAIARLKKPTEILKIQLPYASQLKFPLPPMINLQLLLDELLVKLFCKKI